jgi:chemotaxis protein methyltransferase CheR
MLVADKGEHKVLRSVEGRGRAKTRAVLSANTKAVETRMDSALPEITEREFQSFQELIYREAGIWLSTAKIPLLAGRLSKYLRHHGMQSFQEYFKLVSDSPTERIQMLDAISTNETHFFREPQHFELLRNTIFPRWVAAAAEGNRSRSIRVWSAGCSTGQEPYSLAMALLDYFPRGSGWEIEIVATDLSTRVLEIAKKGVWSAEKTREIPVEYLKAFMLKGFAEQAGQIKAGPEIRSLIRFYRVNLNETTYPFAGKFDLILCRNVLIYFDLKSRERVVCRLANYLSPDGCFFVGHAESLHSMSDILSAIVPTVYKPALKVSEKKHARK